MKTPTLQEFLCYPPHQRRHLKLSPSKGRGSYEKSKVFTTDELVGFLQDLFENEERKTWRNLLRLRNQGDPKAKHYVGNWGSWRKAIECIFPEEQKKIAPSNDPANILRVFLQFKLWTFRKYIQARRDMPSVVPSYNQVLRQFGSFGNLQMIGRRESYGIALREYSRLSNKLGHYASQKECERHGVTIDGWLERYGSRKELVCLIKASKESWSRNHGEPEGNWDIQDIIKS